MSKRYTDAQLQELLAAGIAVSNAMRDQLQAEVDYLRVSLKDSDAAMMLYAKEAARYRWIRERAAGDQGTWQVVEDAAFVSWFGATHNFDLNIDAAMRGEPLP